MRPETNLIKLRTKINAENYGKKKFKKRPKANLILNTFYSRVPPDLKLARMI